MAIMNVWEVKRTPVEMVETTIVHDKYGKIVVKDLIETRKRGLKVIIDSFYLDKAGNPIQDWVLVEEIDEFLSKENIGSGYTENKGMYIDDEEWEKEMGR